MDNKFTVYMHITPNGKRYIGITCRKPEYRWNHGRGYEKNSHFFNAILKFGWDNIQHLIISENMTKEEACSLEQLLIKMYHTTDEKFGYNQSMGGECGSFGVEFTEERKRKIGDAHKGMKHTEDAKKKMSDGHKGIPSWNKGRHWTQAEKEIMRKAQNTCKPVICIETNVVYFGARDASEKTGINRNSIKDCCNHRKYCKSAGGYHWKYASIVEV